MDMDYGFSIMHYALCILRGGPPAGPDPDPPPRLIHLCQRVFAVTKRSGTINYVAVGHSKTHKVWNRIRNTLWISLGSSLAKRCIDSHFRILQCFPCTGRNYDCMYAPYKHLAHSLQALCNAFASHLRILCNLLAMHLHGTFRRLTLATCIKYYS